MCLDRATAQFKGNSIPIERPGVGEEGTSSSFEGVWLTAECPTTMASGGRCSMCLVPRECVEDSSMATSVSGDSGESCGGIAAVAVISSRTPKVE